MVYFDILFMSLNYVVFRFQRQYVLHQIPILLHQNRTRLEEEVSMSVYQIAIYFKRISAYTVTTLHKADVFQSIAMSYCFYIISFSKKVFKLFKKTNEFMGCPEKVRLIFLFLFQINLVCLFKHIKKRLRIRREGLNDIRYNIHDVDCIRIL